MLLRSIEKRFMSVDDKFKEQFDRQKQILKHTIIILFLPIGPKQRWYLSTRILLESDQKKFSII